MLLFLLLFLSGDNLSDCPLRFGALEAFPFPFPLSSSFAFPYVHIFLPRDFRGVCQSDYPSHPGNKPQSTRCKRPRWAKKAHPAPDLVDIVHPSQNLKRNWSTGFFPDWESWAVLTRGSEPPNWDRL